jgi:hypothetical protein
MDDNMTAQQQHQNYENQVRRLLEHLRDRMLDYQKKSQAEIDHAHKQAGMFKEQFEKEKETRQAQQKKTLAAKNTSAEQKLAQGIVSAAHQSGEDASINMLGHSLAYGIEKVLGRAVAATIGKILVNGWQAEKSPTVDFEVLDQKPSFMSLPASKKTFDAFRDKQPEALAVGTQGAVRVRRLAPPADGAVG